jgi:hypothetical protein
MAALAHSQRQVLGLLFSRWQSRTIRPRLRCRFVLYAYAKGSSVTFYAHDRS